MPKFIVPVTKPVTDYLVAEVEVEAADPIEAFRLVQQFINEGDDRVTELEFAFDECGDAGEISIDESRGGVKGEDGEWIAARVPMEVLFGVDVPAGYGKCETCGGLWPLQGNSFNCEACA